MPLHPSRIRCLAALSFAAVFGLAAAMPSMAQNSELNIYTTREPGLIQPLLDSFSQETGVKVNIVFLRWAAGAGQGRG